MPQRNHFRHQQYVACEPTAPWRLGSATFPAQPNSKEFEDCRNRFGETVSEHIDSILLVHGTFAGNDALGWFSQMERIVPAAGPLLKRYGKKLTDALAGDDGNYTPRFLELFPPELTTRRFVWSGENTHSGRCRAAIELLDALLSKLDSESRIILWTHSHAANVVALVTNLIGAESWMQRKFLEIVEPLFSSVDTGRDLFARVTAGLKSNLAGNLKLDVVNFGAPITYGWDTLAYRRLLHVVNHTPLSDQPDWLSPPKMAGFRSNEPCGDLMQILGITGSDFMPWLLDSKARCVEKSLHQFLAVDFSRRNWWARAGIGMRVAEEGETILIDYENRYKLASVTLGHSIYTRPEWLSFHFDLVADMY